MCVCVCVCVEDPSTVIISSSSSGAGVADSKEELGTRPGVVVVGGGGSIRAVKEVNFHGVSPCFSQRCVPFGGR